MTGRQGYESNPAPADPDDVPRAGPVRRPGRLFAVGTDPDPRFTLANERTFLAWIRTSLALFAAGIALEGLNLPIHPGYRLAAAVLLIALGTLTPAHAWLGWLRTERALRLSRGLPPPTSMAVPLATGLLTVGILLTLGLLR
ncbi:YidH family protein [Micromonospora sp. NPDC049900]|uniref:YidH family protein n=1 Tax=unclassified Micromonospora TaxID=2617518 RepID=UPI0037AF866E